MYSLCLYSECNKILCFIFTCMFLVRFLECLQLFDDIWYLIYDNDIWVPMQSLPYMRCDWLAKLPCVVTWALLVDFFCDKAVMILSWHVYNALKVYMYNAFFCRQVHFPMYCALFAVNGTPILKAGALKYLMVFRSQVRWPRVNDGQL